MFRRLIAFDEAKRAVSEQIKYEFRSGDEIALLDAYDRVLRKNVVSELDVPPFDRSTVDGYSVKAEDTSGAEENQPVKLIIRGMVSVGKPPRICVGKGEAAEIVTGAPIPEGADAVVKVEDTHKKDTELEVFRVVTLYENVMKRGTDIKRGETILKAGALTSHIIYLKSGFVKEFVEGQKGRSKILQIIKHHSYLGLSSMFGSRVNQFSYAAITDLRVCHIDINVFVRFLKEKGDFAYEILSYVCRESLINQFHLINQSNKKMYGRFSDALIYLSENIFESPSFDLHLTREELAGMVGISRENIGRTISRFREEGIIRIKGRRIDIEKMDVLKQISKTG